MGDGGKGSKPRPFSIPHDQFESNWDRIFGKGGKDKDQPQRGDQRINNEGKTEEYAEGYWRQTDVE